MEPRPRELPGVRSVAPRQDLNAGRPELRDVPTTRVVARSGRAEERGGGRVHRRPGSEEGGQEVGPRHLAFDRQDQAIQVTDRIGRDKQIKDYDTAIGYQP